MRVNGFDVMRVALVEFRFADATGRRIINAVVMEYTRRLRYCVRSWWWLGWIMFPAPSLRLRSPSVPGKRTRTQLRNSPVRPSGC